MEYKGKCGDKIKHSMNVVTFRFLELKDIDDNMFRYVVPFAVSRKFKLRRELTIFAVRVSHKTWAPRESNIHMKVQRHAC